VSTAVAQCFSRLWILFSRVSIGETGKGLATEIHMVLCKQFGEDSDVRQREGGAALEMAKDRPTGIGRPF
jgi:hypothetical protein